ncbi:MAG: hypothetical protein LBR69_03880 [Endomicrobium sp.]|jgi:ribosomal protein L18|nr:hypothetical protein [Endomicrobium sp.]
MKKIILAAVFAFIFVQPALCARVFVEGEDYTVDFQRKDENMAAVLHINFIDAPPSEQEAEIVLKEQLGIYAQIIESEEAEAEAGSGEKEPEQTEPEKKEPAKNENEAAAESEAAAAAEEEEKKYKNIIGSVWRNDSLNPEVPVKIKFKEDLASYVYLGKTKTIVPFPEYITFLKKEREERKEKEKEKAKAEAEAAAAAVSGAENQQNP